MVLKEINLYRVDNGLERRQSGGFNRMFKMVLKEVNFDCIDNGLERSPLP